jgi:hypothetical protein
LLPVAIRKSSSCDRRPGCLASLRLHVKFDVAAAAVDDYPKPIAGAWPSLPFDSGLVDPEQPAADRIVREAFPQFSTHFEGRVPWMHLGVKGLVTIGSK